jgi:hypothetical protein
VSMEIEFIQTEEEKTQSIVRNGEWILEIAKKYWDGEELTSMEKHRLTSALVWLGNDMKNRSSRYMPPKPQGRQSFIPDGDILMEFYGYTLDEKTTKTYAYEALAEKYNVSIDTIKNLVKTDENDPKGVKQFFFINVEISTKHRKKD